MSNFGEMLKVNNLIKFLEDRQKDSEKYWEETYSDMKPIYNISGAEPLDNMSWEIGFYEGLQYALDQAHRELARETLLKWKLSNE